MNATFRFGVKAFLVATVSAALFSQVVGLFAQDGSPAKGSGSATPKIRQTAASQESQPSTQSTPNSDVMKELEKKFRENGRQMPSMNMDDLPNTQVPVPPPSNAGSAAAPGANHSAAKPGKPNFIERWLHIGRGKRQPAAAVKQPPAQYARPTPPTAPRYPMPQPGARPAAPTYRTPTVVRTPAPQVTAQPQLREPAPVVDPSTPSVQAARPALRPGLRDAKSQPLLDESDADNDSESLDLNQNVQPKVANQPPQILPSQTANGPAESPYTGLKISPNEMEQKLTSHPNPARGPEVAIQPQVLTPEPRISSAAPATLPVQDAAVSNPRQPVPSAAAPQAAPTGRHKNDDLGMTDDDEDDEDDDETLTLPVDEPVKAAQKPAEPATEVSAAERDKPTREIAKPAAESAKPTPETAKPATEIKNEPVPAIAKGFRGFCPVVLKDERKLIEARPHIRSEFRGKIYTFSTVEAKDAFEENPRKYVPAGDGNDVVRLTSGETGVEGTLEHAAWYRGRLYLFSSAQTRREFVETPSRYVVND